MATKAGCVGASTKSLIVETLFEIICAGLTSLDVTWPETLVCQRVEALVKTFSFRVAMNEVYGVVESPNTSTDTNLKNPLFLLWAMYHTCENTSQVNRFVRTNIRQRETVSYRFVHPQLMVRLRGINSPVVCCCWWLLVCSVCWVCFCSEF